MNFDFQDYFEMAAKYHKKALDLENFWFLPMIFCNIYLITQSK